MTVFVTYKVAPSSNEKMKQQSHIVITVTLHWTLCLVLIGWQGRGVDGDTRRRTAFSLEFLDQDQNKPWEQQRGGTVLFSGQVPTGAALSESLCSRCVTAGSASESHSLSNFNSSCDDNSQSADGGQFSTYWSFYLHFSLIIHNCLIATCADRWCVGGLHHFRADLVAMEPGTNDHSCFCFPLGAQPVNNAGGWPCEGRRR